MLERLEAAIAERRGADAGVFLRRVAQREGPRRDPEEGRRGGDRGGDRRQGRRARRRSSTRPPTSGSTASSCSRGTAWPLARGARRARAPRGPLGHRREGLARERKSHDRLHLLQDRRAARSRAARSTRTTTCSPSTTSIPLAPVHFMIIPKTHVDSLATVDDGARARCSGRMLAMAGRLAREQGSPDGFRTIVNTGRIGRQDVYHFTSTSRRPGPAPAHDREGVASGRARIGDFTWVHSASGTGSSSW